MSAAVSLILQSDCVVFQTMDCSPEKSRLDIHSSGKLRHIYDSQRINPKLCSIDTNSHLYPVTCQQDMSASPIKMETDD